MAPRVIKQEGIDEHPHVDSFEIVAVAASAGGLTALGEILSGLPADFPVPILIVQRLDPRHRSLMVEILEKRTPLNVEQAKDKVAVQAALEGLLEYLNARGFDFTSYKRSNLTRLCCL